MQGFQNFCLTYANFFSQNPILIDFQFNLKCVSVLNTCECNEDFIEKKYNRTEWDKENMLVEKTSNLGIISEKHLNVCLKGK